MFAKIDAASAAFAEKHKLPGLVAGIVDQGRLVHVTALGLADREAGRPVARDTAFRIASMTKNMTALAILSLRDVGQVVLDAPLAEYVPQFAAVKPATVDSRPVTVRDLLCHVAGFVTDDPWGDRVLGMTPAALDELIATGTLFARAPGIAYEYSNLGYALLGRVLTNVSGEPYQDYMRRLFLAPLGMARTTFDALAAARGDYAFGYRLDGKAWSRERIEPDGDPMPMSGPAGLHCRSQTSHCPHLFSDPDPTHRYGFYIKPSPAECFNQTGKCPPSFSGGKRLDWCLARCESPTGATKGRTLTRHGFLVRLPRGVSDLFPGSSCIIRSRGWWSITVPPLH